jgi:ankyrin repeat protein
MPKLDLDKALLYSATTSNIDVVRFLIDKGANVNARDETGDTPLINNCEDFGSTEIRELLLRKGANPKLRDKWGRTADDHCRHSRG